MLNRDFGNLVAPLPQSTPKNKDLADSTPGLTFQSPDLPIAESPDSCSVIRVDQW
jgi:hypothetical protein